jgi:nucleoside-diphosphate-sugar epimerase
LKYAEKGLRIGKMRVLVTGHQGYIGTVMVPMLQSKGYEVRGFDSDLFEGCTCGSCPTVPYLRKDIRDAEVSDLRGFHAVIHLAALSNDPLGNLNSRTTYSINFDAAVNLAKLAKEAGVDRFLFASSCSVYGESEGDILTEKTEPHPITPYAISKMLAEEDISNMADSRFSPIFLRCATAYGASPKLRFDLVLNNLTAWAHTTGIVFLKSNGEAYRPLVHVEDISHAFTAILGASREMVHNEIFNVGVTEETYQIRRLAEIVEEAISGSRIEYAKGASSDRRSYRVDFSKLRGTISEFKPRWMVRQGIDQLCQTYKRIGLTLSEFEGAKYRRLEHLKRNLRTGRLDRTLRWIRVKGR